MHHGLSPRAASEATVVMILVFVWGCPPPAPDASSVDGGEGAACGNGIDDDDDGFVDFPGEPGCASPDDPDETDPAFPRGCWNVQDDDDDGLVDFGEDPGCTSAWDDDEVDPPAPPQCSNGVDDDADALVDFPTDPGCSDADDDLERQPECSDGLDNDADSQIDFPLDIDCTSAVDDSEATEPRCSNGWDDDLDMFVDFPLDPGCDSPFDDDEWNPPPCDNPTMTPVLDLPLGGVATGSLFGMSDFTGSCGGGGPEVIYWVDAPGPLEQFVADSAGSDLTTAVYARFQCGLPPAEYGCSTSPTHARLTLTNVPDAPIFVFVDGRFALSSGDYVLTVGGVLAPGSSCSPGDPVFQCGAGFSCLDVGAGPICTTGECSDGVDNDADALVDYGADPGCASPDDGDEIDPVPLPECADGVDNDGDMLVDFGSDSGCAAPGDDTELEICPDEVVPVDLTTIGSAAGNTVGPSFFAGSCGGNAAPEAVFYVDPPGPLDALSASSSGSGFDTVVYAREASCGTGVEVGCADDGAGLAAVLTTGPLTGSRIFLFVDGFGGAAGPYSLAVSAILAPLAPCSPTSLVFDCDTSAGFACEESTPGAGDFACRTIVCANGLDDDGDGHADWPLDLGCSAPDDTDETPDPACWNGTDDDGDSNTDFPYDPGCDDPTDGDESTATTPACADGTDNDGDGDIDFPFDPSCSAATDDDEADACTGPAPADITATVLAAAPAEAIFAGSTATASNDHASGCGGGSAPDATFALRLLDARTTLRAKTVSPAGGGGFDTIVSIRGPSCAPADELDCSDDEPACCYSDSEVSPAWPGTYFIVVDGDGAASGDFELRVSVAP